MSSYRYYGPDICDKDGAEGLRDKIKAYWAARGHEVDVQTQFNHFNRVMRSGFYAIRSNLRNGLPPRALMAGLGKGQQADPPGEAGRPSPAVAAARPVLPSKPEAH